MKRFFHIFHIGVFIILFVATISMIYTLQASNFSLAWFMSAGVIVLLEFLAIFYLVQKFYAKPIKDLEYTIKKFLVGSLKQKDIAFHKTLNPHLNYILLFFTKTLTTLKNIKWEFIHGKEIKWEVELAREIQEKLLSKKIEHIPSLSIVARSKPAKEIGGDSFDIIPQGNDYFIYVWDATGHGVWAGFIMMMVNALVHGYSKVTTKWNQILAHTNDIIKPRVKANLLMSMLLLRWNETDKRLYMTWAGHEYLMIYKYSKQKCFKIKSWWVALGMAKNIHKLLKEREVAFEKNDIAILYSDGITEAINLPEKNGDEEMFWEDRLIQAIEESPNVEWKDYKSAKSVFKNITIELSKFMWYKYDQLDDITLVVAQYKPNDYDITKDFSEHISDELVTEWNWDS